MLDLAGPPQPWPDQIGAIWRDALAASADTSGYWRTPPYLGLPELRAWFGAALEVDPNRVVITAGVRSAVPLLVASGAPVLLEVPTFLGIRRLLEQTGHPTVPLSWSDLAKRPAHSGAVVWVTSPGRNPDGASLTETQARSLEAWAACGGRVVVDETYHGQRLGCRAPPPGLALLIVKGRLYDPHPDHRRCWLHRQQLC